MPRYFIVFIIMDKDQDEDDLPEAVGDENQDDGYYHHCYKYHYGDENQDKDSSHWLQARDAVKSLRNALGDENQVKDDYYRYYYSHHSYKAKRYYGYKAKRYYGYHAKRYYGHSRYYGKRYSRYYGKRYGHSHYYGKRYGHSHYYGHYYGHHSHHNKHPSYAKLCYRYYYYYYGDAHQVSDDYVWGQKCHKYVFNNKYSGDENEDNDASH